MTGSKALLMPGRQKSSAMAEGQLTWDLKPQQSAQAGHGPLGPL